MLFKPNDILDGYAYSNRAQIYREGNIKIMTVFEIPFEREKMNSPYALQFFDHVRVQIYFFK